MYEELAGVLRTLLGMEEMECSYLFIPHYR